MYFFEQAQNCCSR